MASRKPAGIYVKPSPEVIEYFKKKAEENRRTLADEVGLYLDAALIKDSSVVLKISKDSGPSEGEYVKAGPVK